jgi:hypothetical protein
VSSPHGLAFTPDERWILVADADAPVVHAYRSDDASWEGERDPYASVQIIGDASYERGRYLPGEGGPKGIDLTPDASVLVATCHEEPLVFFDVRPVLGRIPACGEPLSGDAESDQARRFLLRYLGAACSRVDAATAAIRRTSEQELRILTGSRWWRATAPLRRLTPYLYDAAQRARHRLTLSARTDAAGKR